MEATWQWKVKWERDLCSHCRYPIRRAGGQTKPSMNAGEPIPKWPGAGCKLSNADDYGDKVQNLSCGRRPVDLQAHQLDPGDGVIPVPSRDQRRTSAPRDG